MAGEHFTTLYDVVHSWCGVYTTWVNGCNTSAQHKETPYTYNSWHLLERWMQHYTIDGHSYLIAGATGLPDKPLLYYPSLSIMYHHYSRLCTQTNPPLQQQQCSEYTAVQSCFVGRQRFVFRRPTPIYHRLVLGHNINLSFPMANTLPSTSPQTSLNQVLFWFDLMEEFTLTCTSPTTARIRNSNSGVT